jgi:thiol-disulfide isomerase/thioredoxin
MRFRPFASIVLACSFFLLGVLLPPAPARADQYPLLKPGARAPELPPDVRWVLNASGENDPSLRLGDGVHSVLLDFSTTWCIFCNEQAPAMDRLAEKYASLSVRLFTLSIEDDEPELVRRHFGRTLGAKNPVGVAPPSIRERFGINGFPTVILFSPEGVVQWVWYGNAGEREMEEVIHQVATASFDPQAYQAARDREARIEEELDQARKALKRLPKSEWARKRLVSALWARREVLDGKISRDPGFWAGYVDRVAINKELLHDDHPRLVSLVQEDWRALFKTADLNNYASACLLANAMVSQEDPELLNPPLAIMLSEACLRLAPRRNYSLRIAALGRLQIGIRGPAVTALLREGASYLERSLQTTTGIMRIGKEEQLGWFRAKLREYGGF